MTDEEQLRERIRRAHVPVYLRDVRLVDLGLWPGEAILRAQIWAQQGGLLYLYGPNGTGKTTLAAAALIERLRRRPGGRFIDAQELGVLAAGDFRSGDPMRAMRIATRSLPLVLDDLGQERHNAQVAEVIKTAIRHRLDAGAPLLITSNFRVSELAARDFYGPWLGSRLADARRGVTQLHMAGPDHRLRVLP